MKKLFGILIITLFITCTFTTTASSTNFTNTEKTNEMIPANFEAPIQPIVETEQVDGRTWNFKVYAYNTLDEEVTIKTKTSWTYSKIYNDEWAWIYETFGWGPIRNRICLIPNVFLNIYPQTKSFSANEKMPIYEFTFKGHPTMILLVLQHIEPWYLSGGEYMESSYLSYKYNGELHEIHTDDIHFTLES